MVPWEFVALVMCVLMRLRRLECRSACLVTLGGVSLLVLRVWGQVLSPLTGGSPSVNIMPSLFCPSATLRAALSASALCVTPVCPFTLPICVLYPMLSLVRMMSSASCKRCLCGWCMLLSGSMAYLRMVLMLKALFVRIDRVWSSLLASSAMVIATSSARLIVCCSGCDFISIHVVVWVFGFIMDAPSVGLPVTRDPSV